MEVQGGFGRQRLVVSIRGRAQQVGRALKSLGRGVFSELGLWSHRGNSPDVPWAVLSLEATVWLLWGMVGGSWWLVH